MEPHSSDIYILQLFSSLFRVGHRVFAHFLIHGVLAISLVQLLLLLDFHTHLAAVARRSRRAIPYSPSFYKAFHVSLRLLTIF